MAQPNGYDSAKNFPLLLRRFETPVQQDFPH
jgi:hypothetical protein